MQVLVAEIVDQRRTLETVGPAVKIGQSRRVAPVFGARVVQPPVEVPACDIVIAAERGGPDELHRFQIVEVVVEVDAVNRPAQGRVAGADVGVTRRAAGHGAPAIGAVGAGGARGRGLAVIEVPFDVVAQLVVAILGVDRGQEHVVRRVRTPAEPARERPVVARQAIELVFVLTAPQRPGLGARKRVLADRLPVGLEVVGDHVALVIGRREQRPERAVGELVRDDEGGVDLLAAAERHVTKPGFAGHAKAGIVERAARHDVDVAGERLARHVRRDRLAGLDLRGEGGRDVVEARSAPLRADDVDAVEGQGGPARRRAAQVHIAGLALVALDADARQAADREGDVLVGKAPHRVGGDDRDDRGDVALRGEGGFLRVGDRPRSDHQNLVCAKLGRVARILCRGCAGERRGQERNAGRPVEILRFHEDPLLTTGLRFRGALRLWP